MRGRKTLLVGAFAAGALFAATNAWAHVRISPDVSLSKQLQLYSLAVPTEKEGVTTTQVVLTVPPASRSTRLCPARAGSVPCSPRGQARTPSSRR